MVPATSNRPSRRGRDAGTVRTLAQTVATTTGTLIQNTSRQLAASTSSPPRIGPAGNASEDAAAQVPSARACAARSGKTSAITAIVVGSSSAPPTPWTTRAPMSTPVPGAVAHATDAAPNTASPASSTRR